MSNITLWGAIYDTDYVDLPKSGGGTARFSEGGGNDFIITLSLVNNVWTPDKTFAEIQTAYNTGKNIAVKTNNVEYIADGQYDSDGYLPYTVDHYDYNTNNYTTQWYIFDSNGVTDDGNVVFYSPYDADAVPSDVTQGKIFYNANGRQTGTASGGDTPSATSHTILFEFTDETSTTITAYYDSTFISDAIRATTPTTVSGKTVASAQLDGVTWYEPANIPIGVQLIEYNDALTGYAINADGSIVSSESWNCVTDYTEIDSSMTFTFACSQYAYIGFYDKNKNAIRTVSANDIKDGAENYFAFGTLDSSIIPAGAAYVVLPGNSYDIEELSLIRTA